MRPIRFAVILYFAALSALSEGPSAPVANKTIRIDREALAGLPRVTVEASEHDGTAASWEGVTLGSLLERSGLPRGEAVRGAVLRTVVVLTATDGYRVVFSLAETDPAFNDRLILIADRKNGKPLPETEGPFRLVVPSERRPARWIRNVATIEIRSVE